MGAILIVLVCLGIVLAGSLHHFGFCIEAFAVPAAIWLLMPFAKIRTE